mgnify:CR=1 FL=1
MSFRVLLDEIRKNLTMILEDQQISEFAFVLEPAKEGFGDISCNIAFLAAKKLKMKPNEIAQNISKHYEKYLGDLVLKVEPHPSGYLNFFANDAKLSQVIIKETQNKDFGSIEIGNKKIITVEHTSVNPNKALHVGHVRNVVVGDSIIRILKKAGYRINTLNYVDDSGLQVADILLGFKHLGFELEPPSGIKFDHYCGDEVYVKTTEKYQTNPELEQKRNQILKEIEDGNSDTAKFASEITSRVLSEQLKTCWRLGASYDCLNFESEIVRSKLWPEIFEKLKQMNLIKFESDGKNKGCWVILGDGEEDKVLVRSNGTATYIAKDIPYAAWKLGLVEDPFYYKKYCDQSDGKTLYQTTLQSNDLPKNDYSSDKVITVIDSRQARLQDIITGLMAKFSENKKEYVHLSYESVTLSSETANSLGMDTGGKSAQMSGRKGLYVNADKILDMLEQKTYDETKKRNPESSEQVLHDIAKNVAVATLRYEMIKQDLDKIITFDTTKSLSLEGDTASYIQYAFARASRILEKSSMSPNFEANYELLSDKYETSLIKQIGKLDLAVQDAVNNLSPKIIAKFCYTLAVSFNSFYEHVRVLDAEPNLLNARICLISAFQTCLRNSLDLIGIKTPSRM